VLSEVEQLAATKYWLYTVNTADPEFEISSVTTTDWSPAVEVGTVNVAPEKDPELSVFVVTLKVTGEPSNVAVISEEAANPLPETVTESPT